MHLTPRIGWVDHRPGALGCALAIAVLTAGCARSIRDDSPQDLAGLSLPLITLGSLRLVVPGSVDGRPADVLIDVAGPLSTVSSGCFDSPPATPGSVQFVTASGESLELPEVQLSTARLGSRALGARTFGLLPFADRCELSVGADVLLDYAVHVDPTRREVAIGHSLRRDVYLATLGDRPGAADEIHLVDL